MPTTVDPVPTKKMPNPHASGSKPKVSHAFDQAMRLQRLISDAASELAKDAVSPVLDADERARASSSLAQLAKSWDTLEARKRVLRGLGNPKAVEARNAKPKRKPTKHELMTSEDMPAADQTETGEGIS